MLYPIVTLGLLRLLRGRLGNPFPAQNRNRGEVCFSIVKAATKDVDITPFRRASQSLCQGS
ncbi:MAG: hypothetical protein HOJ24_03070 [Rhodobacteraceae bacterium]|nr:hypothetical protein [Paracoccaceae bacterium]